MRSRGYEWSVWRQGRVQICRSPINQFNEIPLRAKNTWSTDKTICFETLSRFVAPAALENGNCFALFDECLLQVAWLSRAPPLTELVFAAFPISRAKNHAPNPITTDVFPIPGVNWPENVEMGTAWSAERDCISMQRGTGAPSISRTGVKTSR